MLLLKGQAGKRPPGREDPEAFIAGAERDDLDRPWEALDKKAVPRTTFNLRLNDYELTLLRWLAEQRDESMRKVAKRLLIPALEQLAADALAAPAGRRRLSFQPG